MSTAETLLNTIHTLRSTAAQQIHSHQCNFSFAFYPRDVMLARVIVIATCLSVCLSVRVSVTRRYCVKTKKAIGMISSPSGNPKTLVFRRQISSPNSKGFPPNGGLKQGSVGKIHNCRAVAWRPYMLRRQTATF